jgi:tetratricopeptide (TPR) repeat protein
MKTILSCRAQMSVQSPLIPPLQIWVFALLAALVWPRLGLAQGEGAEGTRTNADAQARFEAGVAAYEEGRYREAVERFKEADELAPSPLLSFNIAKVYERMADNRSALASYRTYLRRLPQADNRTLVEERIAALEQALQANGVQQVTVLSLPTSATVSIDNVARGVTPWTGELIPGPHTLTLRLRGYHESVSEIELPADHAVDIENSLVAGSDAQVTPPPPAEAPAPANAPVAPGPAAPMVEASGAIPHWWTWAMFGGSAAAFVGAGVFELSRSNLEDEARAAEVQIVHRQKYEAMHGRETTARVFLGVGVVAAIAGGVSLYFDLRGGEAPPDSVAFDCAPTGCTLAAGGRF